MAGTSVRHPQYCTTGIHCQVQKRTIAKINRFQKCLKSDYEPEGREFESLRARHLPPALQLRYSPETSDPEYFPDRRCPAKC